MKIRIVRECRDKFTNELYRRGMIVDFEEARALNTIKRGYAKEVKEQPLLEMEIVEEEILEVEEQEEVVEVPPLENEPLKLSELTKAQLVALAKESKVPHSGTKAEIIERLLALDEE